MAKEIAYITGQITGDPNEAVKFAQVENTLKDRTALVVLNPMDLPLGLSQESYMDICLAMVRASTKCYFISDWIKSEGATVEFYYAKKLNKIIYIVDRITREVRKA